MRLAVSNEQMRRAEANAEAAGIPPLQLMKNAGQACFDRIVQLCGNVKDKSVVVLAGRGNNGGDGIVLTDLLCGAGANAILIFVLDLPKSECARLCYSIYETGLSVSLYTHQKENVKRALENSELIIDCVFGTGFHGELEDSVADLFKFVNENCSAQKVSVDIPSGCNSDTGEVAENAFKPDFTITLGAVKRGLYSHPCFEQCGILVLADIGIPQSCFDSCEAILTDEMVKEFLPERLPSSHKGTYGKLLNIAGSARFTGAALLSTDAALRMGTGLCTLATPSRVINAIASAVPETTYFPLICDDDGFLNSEGAEQIISLLGQEKYSAVAVGCGLGNNSFTAKTTEFVIKNADCPVIVDADGLNSICPNINILKESRKSVIVTPHPAEFARMTGTTAAKVQSDRIAAAKKFSVEYGTVTVLKGVNTVIAAPTGEAFVNTTGNAGLAKGGSGDVLTGIIASLAAQGVDPFYSAVLGVYLHGLAADKLAKTMPLYGILPRDLPKALSTF